MKIFIVFMALLICFSFFITYYSDLSSYVQLQKRLKMLAEDIAGGCALFVSPESYSEGNIQFSESSADSYAAFMSSEFVNTQRIKGDISVSFEYGERSVTAAVDYSFPDIFRLPFLSVTHIRRISTYRWEE